jgi:glycerol-3-phosphate dehydrogenase (NAD(P)+)
VKNIITEATDDIMGVEFSSVIKNSLAIFMGIISGLGMRRNARALFLVLAIKEMQMYKKEYPSMKNETLLGFAGLGDLFLTATSKESRNFTTGYKIGENNEVDPKEWENTTIEGIRSIDVLVSIANKNKIKLLLLPTLKMIFDNKGKPKELIDRLLSEIDKIDLTNIE